MIMAPKPARQASGHPRESLTEDRFPGIGEGGPDRTILFILSASILGAGGADARAPGVDRARADVSSLPGGGD